MHDLSLVNEQHGVAHFPPTRTRYANWMSRDLPCVASSRTRFLNSSRAFGSSPAAGSSRISTAGSLRRVRARLSRWVWPFERAWLAAGPGG